MTLRSAMVAVLALLAVGVGVALMGKSDRPVRSPEARDRAATVELRRLLARANPVPNPSDPTPQTDEHVLWNAPFSTVFERLRAAADAGDVSAAHALGSRSAMCMTMLRDQTPASMLADFRDEVHVGKGTTDPSDAAHLERRQQNIARRFSRQLDVYEDCAAIGTVRMADYLRWLERAGAAGSATARLRYVEALQTAYSDDRGALIAQIEEAGRRRALARTWLEEGVRNGDESAFYTYSQALKGSWLYREDYPLAMAHAYALELAQQRRMGNFQSRWQEGMRGYGDRLTPAQWTHVTRQGRRIFMATLYHRPIWPNGGPPPDLRPRMPAPPAEPRPGPG